MRYLGLDLGTTSCGVAITDKTNTLATPYKLIKFAPEKYSDALSEVLKIIQENNIDIVVLGLPKNMDNTLGFAAKRSMLFKQMLEEKSIKVQLQDERLTSVEAINIMKTNGKKNINRQKKTDVIAASLILESYLKKVNYEK